MDVAAVAAALETGDMEPTVLLVEDHRAARQAVAEESAPPLRLTTKPRERLFRM